MTGFTFDAKAALHQAQKCRGLPTLPSLPTDHPAGAEKVGTVGKVGTVRLSDPEKTPERVAWPEARRAAVTPALDELRRQADDTTNPENWR